MHFLKNIRSAAHLSNNWDRPRRFGDQLRTRQYYLGFATCLIECLVYWHFYSVNFWAIELIVQVGFPVACVLPSDLLEMEDLA